MEKRIEEMTMGELVDSLESTLARATFFKDESVVVDYVSNKYYLRVDRLISMGKIKLANHYEQMWKELTGHERSVENSN